jgi:uncharacterized protein (TIGR00730 family)
MSELNQTQIDASQESFQKPLHADPAQLDAVQDKAAALLAELEKAPGGDIVGTIITNALKLLRDNTNRGDVKLINSAFAELRYALKVFAPYRDVHKISVFGSARTGPEAPDYIAAVEFGKKMAAVGWMVTTGAGGGIMAAAHGGAGRDPSFGLAIRLPFEQKTNTHIEGDDKLVNFKYFFTRKLMFVRTSSAIACFPGGFGTLDEGFEVLTLVQTGKAAPMPLVLIDHPGGGFWDAWQEHITEHLLKRKLISKSDLSLYLITDSVDAAVAECVRFYKNYHSIRYVRDELVIRIKKAPNAEQLEYIKKNFHDINMSGDFYVSAALKAEADETALADLPRLVFNFNRRDAGRLRELINYLNDVVAE